MGGPFDDRFCHPVGRCVYEISESREWIWIEGAMQSANLPGRDTRYRWSKGSSGFPWWPRLLQGRAYAR